MTIITRFAPSPTGFLHIGGARTALFNWLFTKHNRGKFYLRIEDTDIARSTDEAKEAIVNGLKWLGLDWDSDIVYQSQNLQRHQEVVKELIKNDKAYYCYCTPEELEAEREKARAKGEVWKYDRRWRDRDPNEAPEGIKPVLRLKSPISGQITIKDHVQGEVKVDCSQLDDLILLRADGTPTYMLSVVVDDHDMGITHIIRGDDHLNNSFRQIPIFEAMGWNVPEFAHISLIHGPDGKKLSKRHGALGVEAYQEMGYLPEAMRNYLLRLGWSYGDEEIISTEQAIEWFTLDRIGKSASRFDFQKLESLNAHYIKSSNNDSLISLLKDKAEKEDISFDEVKVKRLQKGLDALTERAKNINDLYESSLIYLKDSPIPISEKAQKQLNEDNLALVREVLEHVEAIDDWNKENLEQAIHSIAEEKDLKFGKIAQPLRSALTGSHASPSIFEVMIVLEKQECISRLRSVL